MSRFVPYTTEYAMSEFNSHGEHQLQQRLKEYPLNTIFDVGCNIGEWTRMTRMYQPNATIHLFELMPNTFAKMIRNIPLDEKLVVNNFGLSEKTGSMEVHVIPDNDRVASVVPGMHPDGIIQYGFAMNGEEYCRIANVAEIDYLKLDTEGHEMSVIHGLSNMIRDNNVKIIQFEYGFVNVLSRTLLMDFYQYLGGYEIGRLTPTGVDFSDYTPFKENFIGPDYVAVHRNHPDIIQRVRSK